MNLVKFNKAFVKWSWPTLLHLQFWRYWTISFPCKSICWKIITEVSKIMKSVQCDIIFIFIEISETPNSFVKIRLVLEIKNCCWFHKKKLSLKTRLHKKCSMLIRAANWELSFLYQLRGFRNTFQALFARKRGLTHPYFVYKMNHFNIVFYLAGDKWHRF